MLLLVLVLAVPSLAAPITFNTALPISEGEGLFRFQAKRFAFVGDGARRDLTVEAVPLVGVWGATPKLALFTVVPFLDKELTLDSPRGRRSRGDAGLGDVTVFARYTAFQKDTTGGTLRVAPFAGTELPTGDHDARDDLGRLPQPLQLGSGSWDPLAGLVVTRQTLSWQADASVSYQANTEANDFEFGDEARLDLSVQRRVWPRELGPGVPAFLYLVLDSNLIRQQRDELGNREVADSGGTTWFLAPGIQYVSRRFVVEGAVQLPVAQDLHGNALETDWIATVSTRFNF